MYFLNQVPEVKILNFQTFTNEYVAKNYGVSEVTIRSHKKLHADELVENIHFVTEQNKFGANETKWTLRGIIKLGVFIRSKEAKSFRLWAEMELEKTILGELESAKEAREQSLSLTNKVISLEIAAKFDAQNYKNAVNSYRLQISRQNNKIAMLNANWLNLKTKSKEWAT